MRKAFEKTSILSLVFVGIIFGIVIYITGSIFHIDSSILAQGTNIIMVMYILYMIRKSGEKLTFDFSVFKKQGIKLEIIKLEAICIVLSIGLIMVFSAVIYMIQLSNMNEILTEEPITGSFMYQFILGVIIAPIVEEFIFRGVIFTRLSTKVSIPKAIIISSALFAILHITKAMGSAFVAGVVLCMLFIKYDNILVNISLHMLNNFIATVMDVFSSKTNDNINYTYSDLGSMIVLGCIFIIPSAYSLIKYIKNNKEIFKKHEPYELKDIS